MDKNKTRIFWLAVGLAVMPIVATSCATTQTPRAQVSDARLAMHVGRRIASDRQVHRYEVDVDALDGVVTLRGIVDTIAERQEAEALAQRTAGVTRVENLIMIESEVGEGERSDFVVRVKIGTRLTSDPDVRRTDIDIDVEEGIVYLSGVVFDDTARTEAEKLARSVEGVREVHNERPVEQPLHPVPRVHSGGSSRPTVFFREAGRERPALHRRSSRTRRRGEADRELRHHHNDRIRRSGLTREAQ